MVETSTGIESRFDVAIEEALPRSPIGGLIGDCFGFALEGSKYRARHTELIKENFQASKEWLQVIARSPRKYLGQLGNKMNDRSDTTTVSVCDSQGELIQRVKLQACERNTPVIPIHHRGKSNNEFRWDWGRETFEGNIEDSVLQDGGKNHLFLRAVRSAYGGFYIP